MILVLRPILQAAMRHQHTMIKVVHCDVTLEAPSNGLLYMKYFGQRAIRTWICNCRR